MEHIASARKTSALEPELDVKYGFLDQFGIFWDPEGGHVTHGPLWIHRSMLDIVRPYGWRLLQYTRGNDMVQVERSRETAMSFMENRDDQA